MLRIIISSNRYYLFITLIFISILALRIPLAQGATIEDAKRIKPILKKIYLFLIYPKEAKEKRWEGIVKVEFLVRRNGSVADVKIKESSGYPLLDKAALWAVKNASPYPFPFENISDIWIEVPITFKLPQEENKKQKVYTSLLPPSQESLKQPIKDTSLESSEAILLSNTQLEDVYSQFLPQELKEFIKIAIENNQPLQVAKEEVNLAKIKLKDALRNLFPSVKFEVYNTKGQVSFNLEYEEREFKINLDQPLYYGGRLRNAWEQAKTNLEITKRNYNQQMLDTVHKTEVAYYTLITLMMNKKKQEEILQKAKEILKVAEKQYKAGVSILLEFKSVKSWYERLKLLEESIKQELKMAYLTFKQVLNIEEYPQVTLYSLPITEFEIDLDSSIKNALDNRPEMNMAKLSVKFYEYNKKIEDSKNRFNVDLTSFYGYYQGAFVTEPMKSSKNWHIGIKVTKPLGPNTSSVSFTKEESQPRFGETAPTATETISSELNIMDNLTLLSNRKNAEIELLKAENQLKETQKNIIFEVQDAFFKYQKALLEVKSALTQKKFREEHFKITETRAYRGEDTYASLIESLVSLSDAENTYLKALGNYYIAVANLRKSTGYSINLKKLYR